MSIFIFYHKGIFKKMNCQCHWSEHTLLKIWESLHTISHQIYLLNLNSTRTLIGEEWLKFMLQYSQTPSLKFEIYLFDQCSVNRKTSILFLFNSLKEFCFYEYFSSCDVDILHCGNGWGFHQRNILNQFIMNHILIYLYHKEASLCLK